MNETNFQNKIVLVTGGARGLGLNIVKAFAKEKAQVIFCDKNTQLGEIQQKEMLSKGLKVKYYEIDLSNHLQCLSLIPKICSEFGGIDILVNNARTRNKNNLLDETIDDWDEAFDVMLKSAFFLSQGAIKVMKAKKRGVIINIASISGRYISSESPSYHMAKAGIIQMTRYLAKHAGSMGIRTNAIAPGFIVQDELIQKYSSKDNKDYKEFAEKCHPLGVIGKSSDITKAIMFLSSEAASFINGEILYLDGGLTIQDPFVLAKHLQNKD